MIVAIGLYERWLGHSIGSGLYWILALSLLVMAAFLVWRDAYRKLADLERTSPVTNADWQDLAGKFSRFPPTYVFAIWRSETLDFPEQWEITDEWNKQFSNDCESLCQLAGAMLLKSPNVASRLSTKVASRTNDAWRWLYFLAEKQGVLKITGVGTAAGRSGVNRGHETGTISELTAVSARACIDCASKEV